MLMRGLLSILTFVLYFTVSPVSAELKFCNESNNPVFVAVKSYDGSDWRTKGWINIKPGQCSDAISGTLKYQNYYFYAEGADGTKWGGSDDTNTGCVKDEIFDIITGTCDSVGGKVVNLREINVGTSGAAYIVELSGSSEPRQEPKLGTIQTKCLASWDDSHQIHSSTIEFTWGRQAVKTTMKKLEHCLRLTVTGPIEIDGIAKSYVDQCVERGLNDKKTLHVLGLIVAIVADVYGGGGAATSAKVAQYVDSAASETISCLTDTTKISAHISEQLKAKFDATVREESNWVYWDL
jgi:uncharacterized membrane protein